MPPRVSQERPCSWCRGHRTGEGRSTLKNPPEHGVHRENRSATPHSNVPANTLIKELPKRIQSMDKEGRKVSCKIITSRYNRVTRQGSR